MQVLSEFKTRFKDFLQSAFAKNSNILICLLIIAVAGVITYRNAFGGPFIFDDLTQILQNPHIQSWQWPWAFIENNRRPFLYATLAYNFHVSGFNAFAYHEFNIRVHILAGMMLFLLVRKTLRLTSMKESFRENADVLALASAILWLVHPVHTQAVTYIIQRAESLMGLLFLSAMVFSSQYFTAKKFPWLIAAGIASFLAGLTKEVALVLPLMVLFYDRTFISRDLRTALEKHRLLYIALSLTWVAMFYLYFTTSPEERLTAGFGMQGMSPLLYLINQPAVILHYVGVSLWPSNLIFDYEWPPVTPMRDLWPSIVVLLSWIVVMAVAFRRYRAVSFLFLSFLIILLPSSSVIPLKDLIFEYRLYLSLCCWSVGIVLLLHWSAEYVVNARNRRAIFILIVTLIAVVLGGMTYQRNKTYANEEVLWLDVIKKQPLNSRALNNLGEYLLRINRDADAKKCFLQSLAVNSNYPDVYANLSTVVGREGHPQEALEYAQKAVSMSPDFAIAHNNAGSALSQMGRYSEAIPYFEKTIELGFVQEGVTLNLAVALANSGQPVKAINILQNMIRLNPQSQEAHELLKKLKADISVVRPIKSEN
jgi:Tfp pilus assembly protein PilF